MDKKVLCALLFIAVENNYISAVVGQSKPPIPTGRNFGFTLNHIKVSEDQGTGGRITGGQDAGVGEYPWQISLQLILFGFIYHICGGTLLNETHVVCAAHCVDGQDVKSLQVVTGAYNVKDLTEASQQRINVISVKIHPGYNSRTIVNDVSIITLAERAKLNQYVKPLRRLAPAGSDQTGQVCVNTGWGNSNPTGGSPAIDPDALQEVHLTVISNVDCANRYKGINGVNGGMICANYAAGGKGACSGDSGGPLVCFNPVGRSPYLVGIVSWSAKPCGQAQYPSVNTRVSQFLPFITGVSA